MDVEMERLLKGYDVVCVNAFAVQIEHKTRVLGGWELKPYAIMHSQFTEVLFLDADNVPVVNPEFLFEQDQYLETGAVFWPDFGRLDPDRQIWALCGVPFRDEPEFESGQLLVDKTRSWRALKLAMYYNEHSDFYYRYIHGDKDTFHMAWRKLEKSYAMPAKGVYSLGGRVMCQHDFDGNRIFQHRNLSKWSLPLRRNRRIRGFLHENDCFTYLIELAEKWDGEVRFDPLEQGAVLRDEVRDVVDEVVSQIFIYRRVGYDERLISFSRDGTIATGAAEREARWGIVIECGNPILVLGSNSSVTCRLHRHKDGCWQGAWQVCEQMPIELVPNPGIANEKDHS